MSKQKYPQAAGSSNTATGVRNVKKNGYTHAFLDAKRARKRAEAEERQAKYDSLSTAAKLKGLGADGSNRQRKRLTEQLAREKTPKQHDKVGGTVTM